MLLALGLLIELATRPKPSPYVAPEISRIKDRGVLRVALRPDLPGLSYLEADSGEYTGLEAEVARAVAFAIFGEHGHVEYVESTSRTALANLDNQLADIAFAQAAAVGTRYGYTAYYYIDAYAVMTLASSGYTNLNDIAGRVVGVVHDADAPRPEVPPALEALLAYGEANGETYTPKVFGSYPEMLGALDGGAIGSVLLQAAYLPRYYGPDKTVISEVLSSVKYCAAVRKGEAGLLEIAGLAIEEMRASGELERLRQKYSLPAFEAADE